MPSSDMILRLLERALNPETWEIGLRENAFIEFKEAFNWANRAAYAKAMAAFANRNGGCLIFGVSDNPTRLVGLRGGGV